MSAGKFLRDAKYSTDAGTIHRIRVQPETVTAVNTQPSGAIDSTTTVYTRKGVRRYGIGARTITLYWSSTAPDGYDPNGYITVPILQKSVFDTLTLGGTFTYLGSEAKILSKSNEKIK